MLSGGSAGERLTWGEAEGVAGFLILVVRDGLPELSCARFAFKNDISDQSENPLWCGDSHMVSDNCSSCTLADSRDGPPIAGTSTLTIRDGPSCIRAFSFRNVVNDDQPDVSL